MASEPRSARPGTTKLPRDPRRVSGAPPPAPRIRGNPPASPPATRSIAKVPQPRLTPKSEAPPTVPERKISRVEPRHFTSRSIPKASSSPHPLFLVGGILGVLFLALLIVAVGVSGSSGRKYRPPAGPKEGTPQEPSILEREALTKCEEGRTLILRSYDIGDRAGLQKGMNLIIEGNTALERVNQMTGKKFDTRPYNEALKMARGKLGELR